MTTLNLYCFGSPRLERDGQPVSVTRRRTMALLIYLALTGRPYSREALATLLWPEHNAPLARAHLRRELFRLKQLTGEEMLFIDREQIAIRPEASISVDVLSFRQHLDTVAGHGHAPGRLCRDCQTELEEAIALYEAAFLTGFNLPDSPEFDEWQFFLGEELKQQMAGALRTLIAWHESQDQALKALPLARRWLSFDPLHEEAHRTLMRLYSYAGQHAAAHPASTRLARASSTTNLASSPRRKRLSYTRRSARGSCPPRQRRACRATCANRKRDNRTSRHSLYRSSVAPASWRNSATCWLVPVALV